MPLSIISFFTYNEGLTSWLDVRPFFFTNATFNLSKKYTDHR